MSRGFDLIRRHLVGRKAGEREAVSPAQEQADTMVPAMVPEGTDPDRADPLSNFTSPPAPPPPPFDPVRVANTPPPPRPVRARPNPREIEMRDPPPSHGGQRTRLPEILRPRDNSSDATTHRAEQPAAPGPVTPSAPQPPRQSPLPGRPAVPEASPRQPERGRDNGAQESARTHAGTSRNVPSGALRARNPRQIIKRIDKTNARAARRHSIFVALMKGLLPGLVLGLAGVFFFYSYDFQPIALPGNVNFDPGKVSVGTEGIRMVAPKLTGVDDKQQTFEIKADEAIQDRADPTKVTLVGIDARVNLADGGTIGFSAQKGVYNTDLNQIWLDDELEIRSSEGYVAQLSEAQVDFKNGLMVSNKPVLIFTNDGVINAKSIQVLDGGKKVTFSGGVTLNLNGSAGETQ